MPALASTSKKMSGKGPAPSRETEIPDWAWEHFKEKALRHVATRKLHNEDSVKIDVKLMLDALLGHIESDFDPQDEDQEDHDTELQRRFKVIVAIIVTWYREQLMGFNLSEVYARYTNHYEEFPAVRIALRRFDPKKNGRNSAVGGSQTEIPETQDQQMEVPATQEMQGMEVPATQVDGFQDDADNGVYDVPNLGRDGVEMTSEGEVRANLERGEERQKSFDMAVSQYLAEEAKADSRKRKVWADLESEIALLATEAVKNRDDAAYQSAMHMQEMQRKHREAEAATKAEVAKNEARAEHALLYAAAAKQARTTAGTTGMFDCSVLRQIPLYEGQAPRSIEYLPGPSEPKKARQEPMQSKGRIQALTPQQELDEQAMEMMRKGLWPKQGAGRLPHCIKMFRYDGSVPKEEYDGRPSCMLFCAENNLGGVTFAMAADYRAPRPRVAKSGKAREVQYPEQAGEESAPASTYPPLHIYKDKYEDVRVVQAFLSGTGMLGKVAVNSSLRAIASPLATISGNGLMAEPDAFRAVPTGQPLTDDEKADIADAFPDPIPLIEGATVEEWNTFAQQIQVCLMGQQPAPRAMDLHGYSHKAFAAFPVGILVIPDKMWGCIKKVADGSSIEDANFLKQEAKALMTELGEAKDVFMKSVNGYVNIDGCKQFPMDLWELAMKLYAWIARAILSDDEKRKLINLTSEGPDLHNKLEQHLKGLAENGGMSRGEFMLGWGNLVSVLTRDSLGNLTFNDKCRVGDGFRAAGQQVVVNNGDSAVARVQGWITSRTPAGKLLGHMVEEHGISVEGYTWKKGKGEGEGGKVAKKGRGVGGRAR